MDRIIPQTAKITLILKENTVCLCYNSDILLETTYENMKQTLHAFLQEIRHNRKDYTSIEW